MALNMAFACMLAIAIASPDAAAPEPPLPRGDQATISYGYPYKPRGPLGGWSVLSPEYAAEGGLQTKAMDAFSFEWDYFMIHDESGAFKGIVGFVLADPRGRLTSVMPSGCNIAILGKVGGRLISNFENFGTNINASATEAYMDCPAGHGMNPTSHGTLSVYSSFPPTIRLAGEMADVIYDLKVKQDWTERNGLARSQRPGDVIAEGPFAAMTMADVGLFPESNWTVNMFWPRTNVMGTITDKTTNQTFQVSAHGYRENSYGRWLFASGGWDFAIMSDEKSGVQWNWQSYYTVTPAYKTSIGGSTLDFSFVDPATKTLRAVQFSGGQIGWEHPNWKFRNDARQCMPTDAVVTAANDEFVVTASIDIGDDQIAMLSKATPLTEVYVIQEWFPFFSGTIRRQGSTEPLVTFSGIGGGEISMLRNILSSVPTLLCKGFAELYRHPLAHPIHGAAVQDNMPLMA